MRALEQLAGVSNIYSKASKSGYLSVLQANQTWCVTNRQTQTHTHIGEGRTLRTHDDTMAWRNRGKRFFVLADDSLFVFENQQSKAPAAKVTINKQAVLEMVNNVPNCFMLTAEHKLIIAAGNEQNLQSWVAELLRVQNAEAGAVPPFDVLGRLAAHVAGARKVRCCSTHSLTHSLTRSLAGSRFETTLPSSRKALARRLPCCSASRHLRPSLLASNQSYARSLALLLSPLVSRVAFVPVYSSVVRCYVVVGCSFSSVSSGASSSLMPSSYAYPPPITPHRSI